MTGLSLAAEFASLPGGPGNRAFVLVGFMAFIVLSLLLCIVAAPEDDSAADFYTGNRSLTPLQNALALTGDYISTATLLGVTGLVAVAGYDGITMAVSSCLAVGVFLLFAARLRESGRYTLGDVFTIRSPKKSSRIAATTATLAVCLPFLTVQLAGTGSVVALVLGLDDPGARQLCTVFAGVVMICYTVLGGMRGTGLVQILKVAVVFTTMAFLAFLVLRHFHFGVGALLAAAEKGSGLGADYFASGHALGDSAVGRVDFLSLQLTLVLGGACMPHVLMRINSVADGADARRATRHTISLMAVFGTLLVIAGLGAAGVVGSEALRAADGQGQMALMLLAGSLEAGGTGPLGTTLYTAVACSVFVTALAVVAGITLSAAATLAHDLHATVARYRLDPRQEIRSARWAVATVGAIGIGAAVASQGRNVQSLAYLPLTIAASTVLPACLYSLFWSRFNRTGLLFTVYGGILCTSGLYVSSLSFSGTPFSLMPGHDIHWIGLQSTGVMAIPAGFLLGWAGCLLGQRREDARGDVCDAPAERRTVGRRRRRVVAVRDPR